MSFSGIYLRKSDAKESRKGKHPALVTVVLQWRDVVLNMPFMLEITQSGFLEPRFDDSAD
jgi:hypothetical protein